MDLGAEPPLDAVLVDELQTAGAVAGLQEWVGRRVLAHLADPAQVALLLVRLLQQQPEGGDTVALRASDFRNCFQLDRRSQNLWGHRVLNTWEGRRCVDQRLRAPGGRQTPTPQSLHELLDQLSPIQWDRLRSKLMGDILFPRAPSEPSPVPLLDLPQPLLIRTRPSRLFLLICCLLAAAAG